MLEMLDFKTLDTVPLEEILEAHNDAFSEYEVPMNLSLDEFKHINQRRGVRYDLSIGAFKEGKLIGFVLNGIGEWEGVHTAYDCGTGVIQAFQGQKIAPALFQHLTPLLVNNKISQYLLEVIKTNEAGVKLYSRMGFQIIREFECVVIEKEGMHLNTRKPELPSYRVEEVSDPDWATLQSFWDFPPSWQNSIDSVARAQPSFTVLLIYFGNRPVGYGVVEPRSGGITQLAIHPAHRQMKLGSLILQRLREKCPVSPKMHIINIDTRMTSLRKFCKKIGFLSFTTQYEMIKQLK